MEMHARGVDSGLSWLTVLYNGRYIGAGFTVVNT